MLLGVLTTAVGATAFVVQADAALEGDGLASFDPQLTADVVAHRTASVSNVASAITAVGEIPVLTGLTIVVAVLLRIFTRRWRPAIILAIGMAGAAVLTAASNS